MKPFENIVGKGENAGDQHFLLFQQCFLPVQKTNFNFSVRSILSSANAFNLDSSKILLFGKELKSLLRLQQDLVIGVQGLKKETSLLICIENNDKKSFYNSLPHNPDF